MTIHFQQFLQKFILIFRCDVKVVFIFRKDNQSARCSSTFMKTAPHRLTNSDSRDFKNINPKHIIDDAYNQFFIFDFSFNKKKLINIIRLIPTKIKTINIQFQKSLSK